LAPDRPPRGPALDFLRHRLRREAVSAVPELFGAFTGGPPDVQLAQVRRAAVRRYAARRKVLERGDLALPAQELKRLAAVTQAQYVDAVVKRYVRGYRTSAIAGLGVVGSAEAKRVLKDIEQSLPDDDLDLRRLVERALAGR
jgi:hypothetical protein